MTRKAEIKVNTTPRQGIPKVASKPPEARKRQRVIFYRFQMEDVSVGTLISDL